MPRTAKQLWYPPTSKSPLNLKAAFPQRILFRGQGSSSLWREYEECGCYGEYSGKNEFAIYCTSCTFHGGAAPCVWTRQQKEERLVAADRALTEKMSDLQAGLTYGQAKQKELQERLAELRRDASPVRK